MKYLFTRLLSVANKQGISTDYDYFHNLNDKPISSPSSMSVFATSHVLITRSGFSDKGLAGSVNWYPN